MVETLIPRGGLGDEVSEYVLYEPWIGQEAVATGGGWFIPETGTDAEGKNKDEGLVNPGGKATFGFVAKQKSDTSAAIRGRSKGFRLP